MATAEPDTDELLRRAEQGDAPARERLLGRHRQRLRQMIAVRLDRRLLARLDPSDVVQEVLVDAHRQLDDGQPLAAIIRELRQLSGTGKAAPPQAEEAPAGEAGPPVEQPTAPYTMPLSPAGLPAAETAAQAGLTTEGVARGAAYFRGVARLGEQAAQALQEAAAVYRNAIRAMPENSFFHFKLGDLFTQKQAWDEAIAAFQETIRLNQATPAYYFSLGLAYRAKGALNDAAAFRSAARLKPGESAYHKHLGDVLMEKKEWDEAIAAYTEAIRCKPALGLNHWHLGLALKGKGQLSDALKALRRGHLLGANEKGWWMVPSASWIEGCEALIARPSPPEQVT